MARNEFAQLYTKQEMTAIDLVTKAGLDLIHEKINKLITLLDTRTDTSTGEWLKSSDVKHLLRCGSSTLAGYRAKGILTARKMGGVCYYYRKEVLRLLGLE